MDLIVYYFIWIYYIICIHHVIRVHWRLHFIQNVLHYMYVLWFILLFLLILSSSGYFQLFTVTNNVTNEIFVNKSWYPFLIIFLGQIKCLQLVWGSWYIFLSEKLRSSWTWTINAYVSPLYHLCQYWVCDSLFLNFVTSIAEKLYIIVLCVFLPLLMRLNIFGMFVFWEHSVLSYFT